MWPLAGHDFENIDHLNDEIAWAYSDDEAVDLEEPDIADRMMKVLLPESVPERPKSFQTRPVFMALEAEGLTILPAIAGVFISCHPASSQWHEAYPREGGVKHTHRAPKWSPNLRSEREALLTAIRYVWHIHFLKTGEGKSHLAKIDEALKK